MKNGKSSIMRLCLGCLLHALCNSEAGPGWSTNWMISWVTYWATLQSFPHFARSQQVSWVLLLVFMVSIFWLPYFVDVVSRHYGFLRWSLKIQQLQIPPRSVGAQTSNDQHPRQMQELLILRGFFVLFPLIVFVFMQINKAFY